MKTRQIDMMFLCGLAVVGAGVYWLVCVPKLAERKKLLSREKALRAQLAKSDEVALSLNQIEAEIVNIKDRLKEFDERLPPTQQVDTFIMQVSQIAARTGLALETIQPKKPETKTLYSQIPLAITGKAKFPNFYNFLAEMRRIPRLTNISEFNVESNTLEPECSIDMTLLIYFSKHGV